MDQIEPDQPEKWGPQYDVPTGRQLRSEICPTGRQTPLLYGRDGAYGVFPWVGTTLGHDVEHSIWSKYVIICLYVSSTISTSWGSMQDSLAQVSSDVNPPKPRVTMGSATQPALCWLTLDIFLDESIIIRIITMEVHSSHIAEMNAFSLGVSRNVTTSV